MNKKQSTCLSFEQMQKFVSQTTSHQEQVLIKNHLQNCNLCAMALKGFEEHPFTTEDIYILNKKITSKTKPTTPIHLKLYATVVLIVVAIVFINNFFQKSIYKQNTAKKELSRHLDTQKLFSLLEQKQTKIPSNNKSSPKVKRKIFCKKIDRKQPTLIAPQLINSKKIFIEEAPKITEKPTVQNIPEPNLGNNIIYIHDLKVADYYSLYFEKRNVSNFGKHFLPPVIENEDNQPLLITDQAQKEELRQILEQALLHFNNERYEKSISLFQQLLQYNQNDINALFYEGLAYEYLNKNDLAIENMSNVLEAQNAVFYAEAKWNLAVLLLKTKQTEQANELLEEIIIDNGFYSEKAKELIATVKVY